MDIAAGPGGNGTQEVTGDDGVGIRAADAPRGCGGHAAGTVGAQTAAHALQAKAALSGLALHTVVGRLPWELTDIVFHRFIRAEAGVAAQAAGTAVHRMFPPLCMIPWF